MVRYALYNLEGSLLEKGLASSRKEAIQKVYFDYEDECKFYIIETNIIKYEFKKI